MNAQEVETCVDAFVAAMARGRTPDPDSFCQQFPHLAPVLRGRIEEVLFVEAGIDGVRAASGSWPRQAPDEIGIYRIVRTLGEGGMGVVYLARQHDPVQRDVAIKLIRLGMDSERVLARFHAERRALAQMQHEAIARLFDAGTHTDGQPYFVMEYVEGEPITDYCRHHASSLDERIELVLATCRGIQHAHQRGVMHRDLKPSNILVQGRPPAPLVKIIDFGLARALDEQRAGDVDARTLPGQVVGTPEYMSPEQADGANSAIDVRGDVYSLGVVLYELLADRLPFEGLRKLPLSEMLRVLREQVPSAPSRQAPSHRGIPPDLDAITLKALAKHPEHRYPGIGEFAEDLERWLRHEAVHAVGPSTIYRLRKFMRRYRVQVAAAALVVVIASIGLYVFVWQFARAEQATSRLSLLAMRTQVKQARAEQQLVVPAWPQNSGALEEWLERRAAPLADLLPRIEQIRMEAAAVLERDDASAIDQFLHESLAEFEAELEKFATQDMAAVRARLQWSRTIRQRSIDDHAARWQAAIDAIERADGTVLHERYRGLRLAPQMGLVPIGADPRSRLYEFVHVRSASRDLAVPERDAATGALPVTPESGIVFVLIPPGTFEMGARADDVFANQNERPVHEVSLDAFFLGKHELSRGQWARLNRGDRPSYYTLRKAGEVIRGDNVMPLESVSWLDCERVLSSFGLDMPTEAQWEYACRSDQEGIWSTGMTVETLKGYANVADRSAFRDGPRYGLTISNHDDFDDGYAGQAPIGALLPNAFGLHDMHGNVAEWCRDAFVPFAIPAAGGDGLRQAGDAHADRCVYRGGGSVWQGFIGRCADRDSEPPDRRSPYRGVRAARRVFEDQ